MRPKRRARVAPMAAMAVLTMSFVVVPAPGPAVAGTPGGGGAGLPPPPGSEPAEVGIAGQAVSWNGARTASTPRQLVLSFIGSSPSLQSTDRCWVGFRPEVSFGARQVVVTIRAFHSPTPPPTTPGRVLACTAEGHSRTLAVELPGELGRRQLVDGVSKQRRLVFDGASLLRPGWRADRWELRNEGPWYAADAKAPAWFRAYCPTKLGLAADPAGGTDKCFAITQGPPSVAKLRPGDRVVDHRRVRGVKARIVTNWRSNYVAVAWVENKQGYAVGSTSMGGDIVQVARNLLPARRTRSG